MKTISTIIAALILIFTFSLNAADPAPQKMRVVGVIIQKTTSGLLVDCVDLGTVGAKKARGLILLTGHPDEAKAYDGIGVKCTAIESGTYEYESVSGANRTIKSFAFVSK